MIVLLALSLLIAAPLSAQTTAPALTPEQARAAETAMSRLRSPVTPSHTVEMCPSTGALRDSIRFAAATGASADEMVEDVIARHGEHLRLLPKRSGPGLVAWLATPLLLLIGGALVFARLRAGSGRSGASAGSARAPAIGDADRARLAAAMREMSDDDGLEP